MGVIFASDMPSLFPPERRVQTYRVGDQWRLEHGDAVDFLRTIADEGVDLFVTDPAYESLEKHRKVGTTTRLKKSKASSNEWFPIFPNSRFPEFFREMYRTLRRNSHAYMYSDQETARVVVPMIEAAGFKFWKWLVWVKPHLGMGYHYRARHELVLFFEKGKRNLRDYGVSDVLEFPGVRGGYPTEKPVDLSKLLIGQSTVEHAVVCDPFMGSGSVAEAARSLDRYFVGCDIQEIAVRRTATRLLGRGL